MLSALFYIPYEAISGTELLAHLASVLADFDLIAPELVLVSRPELAARDGAWTFAFGRNATLTTRPQRELGRRYFVEALGETRAFPVGFSGRDAQHKMEVFQWHTTQTNSLYLVSHDHELAGDVAKLRQYQRAHDATAVTLGAQHVGLKASAATMEGARLFSFNGKTLANANLRLTLRRQAKGEGGKLRGAHRTFANLISPGIDPEGDLWPTGKMFAPPPLLATPPADENLRRLDKRAYERSLRHALATGLANHHNVRGAVRLLTVGEPADKLANYLFTEDRDAEAVEVLDLAISAQHPAHTVQLQRRRSLLAAGIRGRARSAKATSPRRRTITPTPIFIGFAVLFLFAIWKLTLM